MAISSFWSQSSETQATGLALISLQVCLSNPNSVDLNNYDPNAAAAEGNKNLDNNIKLPNLTCHFASSGSQATAFINECLQVGFDEQVYSSRIKTFSNVFTQISTPGYARSQNVNFFWRKKEEPNKNLTSTSTSQTNSNEKIKKSTGRCTLATCRANKPPKPPDKPKSDVLHPPKSVSIIEKKDSTNAFEDSDIEGTVSYIKKSCSITGNSPCIGPKCTAASAEKNETISHIKLGRKFVCPIVGKSPCIGPECVTLSAEKKEPVKITTTANPRREVFELVVRRITGAPLATNELMLEWHPPPLPIPRFCQYCYCPSVHYQNKRKRLRRRDSLSKCCIKRSRIPYKQLSKSLSSQRNQCSSCKSLCCFRLCPVIYGRKRKLFKKCT